MTRFIQFRARSFVFAFQGLYYFFKTQPNAWIHLIATFVACVLGSYYSISTSEWLAIILIIALVWVSEAMNTAIESACNAITQEHHEYIKHAKDVGAAAVLIASLFSLIIAAIIFIPYL